MKKIFNYTLAAVTLWLGFLYVVKFGGPNILKLYVETGIGSCQQVPIICMEPGIDIAAQINKEYAQELASYKFPGALTISAPKGFTVIQERTKKDYYKKWAHKHKADIAYVTYQEPGFFVNLFPDLKKQGITDNYEFIKHVMSARLNNIRTLTDAFFVIMKGIFTPDLGHQNTAVMASFKTADKRGFINYNLGKNANYFDCNIIDKEGGFFKVYIKDLGVKLDLDNVLTIISTVRR